MGAAVGFLWWNAAPARSSWATPARWRSEGCSERSRSRRTRIAARDPRRPLRDRDDVGDPAGDLVPRVRTGSSRMSPIHHHFELAGWPEFTVIVRFWIIAGLCVAVGLGVFYADFIARGGLGWRTVRGQRAVVVGAGSPAWGGPGPGGRGRPDVRERRADASRGTPVASELTALGASSATGATTPSTSTARPSSWSALASGRAVVGGLGSADSPSGRDGARRDSRRRRTSPSPARTGRRPSPR